MVHLDIRVCDGVKVLTSRHAFIAPETATVPDVFGKLSTGLLHGSNPLSEDYQTTSVQAIIGRSSSLHTRDDSELFNQSCRL